MGNPCNNPGHCSPSEACENLFVLCVCHRVLNQWSVQNVLTKTKVVGPIWNQCLVASFHFGGFRLSMHLSIKRWNPSHMLYELQKTLSYIISCRCHFNERRQIVKTLTRYLIEISCLNEGWFHCLFRCKESLPNFVVLYVIVIVCLVDFCEQTIYYVGFLIVNCVY